MKRLITRLRDAARADPGTVPFAVATPPSIEAAEDLLGFPLPRMLERLYLEIGNGGFGPGPLIGLPGGYESGCGDLLQTWATMQQEDEFEEEWLPIIDWGCNLYSLIDCDDLQMVTRYEGDFHPEDYSFEMLLLRWLDGEVPELQTGGFFRPER